MSSTDVTVCRVIIIVLPANKARGCRTGLKPPMLIKVRQTNFYWWIKYCFYLLKKQTAINASEAVCLRCRVARQRLDASGLLTERNLISFSSY